MSNWIETRECFTLSLNLPLVLERSSPPRFLLRSAVTGNNFFPTGVKSFIFPHTQTALYFETRGEKDRGERERGDEAARKLDTARSPFYNGARPKADLLHARGGSRARYGTIKGKSFSGRERISRAPDEPQCTLESEYPELLAAEEKRILSSHLPPDFICRFIYEA